MPLSNLTSLDAYEVALTETLSAWPADRMVALAAAAAERWRPAYDAFSATEDWGDPAALGRALDAVWGHVAGTRLPPAAVARNLRQLDDITPHADDFDAIEPIIACAVLADALRACRDPDNSLPFARSALLGVFEGLIEEWPAEPAAQARVWRKAVVRQEVRAQLGLVEAVGAAALDAAGVTALRGRLAALRVKPTPKPAPKPPPGLSNQTAFEQYRRYVESDLRGRVTGEPDPEPDSFLFAVTYLGYWLGRYSRRLQTLNGGYGRLADEPVRLAVLARNRAADAADPGIPPWPQEVREAIEFSLAANFPLGVVDAGSVEAPHASGPSLRRLWFVGRR